MLYFIVRHSGKYSVLELHQLLAILALKVTSQQQQQLHKLNLFPKNTMTYTNHEGGWRKLSVVTRVTSNDIQNDIVPCSLVFYGEDGIVALVLFMGSDWSR